MINTNEKSAFDIDTKEEVKVEETLEQQEYEEVRINFRPRTNCTTVSILGQFNGWIPE
jgi:hypothetical protein